MAIGRQRFGATEWFLEAFEHPLPPLVPSPGEAGRERALLDPRTAPPPWRLRTRRPGDHFQPLGFDEPIELRRFLQSRHVPRFDRDRLPMRPAGPGRDAVRLDLVHYLVDIVRMTSFNVHEAKTHFSKILARVESGEEVVIAKAGRPIAKVVPIRNKTKRVPGRWAGKIWIADDFEAPLPDELLDAFEGRS